MSARSGRSLPAGGIAASGRITPSWKRGGALRRRLAGKGVPGTSASDPLWDELFPAKQVRIVQSVMERVMVGPAGADIRLRVEGLTGFVRDLGAAGTDAQQEAA